MPIIMIPPFDSRKIRFPQDSALYVRRSIEARLSLPSYFYNLAAPHTYLGEIYDYWRSKRN
jgi:hypothetical protein